MNPSTHLAPPEPLLPHSTPTLPTVDVLLRRRTRDEGAQGTRPEPWRERPGGNAWPGLVLPVCALLLLEAVRRARVPAPDATMLLLLSVAGASARNFKAGLTGLAFAAGIVAQRLWPYLKPVTQGTNVPPATMEALYRLGYFALACAFVLGVCEWLRWNGKSAVREAARTRRELLEAATQSERSAAELSCVLEQVADGIVLCDAEGQITFANARARQIYNEPETAPAAYLGRDCRFLTLEGRAFPRRELPLARAARGESVTGLEWRIRRSDGSEVVAQGSAAPVRDRDGNLIGAAMTLRDTSSQRRALAELERANHVKTQFLGVLSHELRTPLTPILGWASLLRGPQAHLLADANAVSGALEAIERNALAQKRLIDDLIDAISLLSGELTLKLAPCLLPGAVNRCVEDFEGTAALRGITFRVEHATSIPPLALDEPRFSQALRHLLSNAVKFSHDNGVITVRTRMDGETIVLLDVIDEGEGISAEALPHIWEMFRQGDGSATRKHGGLGVGLTLAKTLIERHGGDLSAHSDGEGCGSRFTLALPVTG